jgi:hypothetical protein
MEVPHPALESWTKLASVETLLDIHADLSFHPSTFSTLL